MTMKVEKKTRSAAIVTGQRFGRLVAVVRVENGTGGKVRWRCRCDCGAEVEVFSSGLRSGRTRSCGCLRRELGRARMRAAASAQAVESAQMRVKDSVKDLLECHGGRTDVGKN